MKKNIFVLTLLPIFAFSCSAPGVKPKDANFFEAAGNIRTGEFERQYQARQLNLLDTKNTLKSNKNQSRQLNMNLAIASAEKNQLDTDIKNLENKNKKLRKDINRELKANRINKKKNTSLTKKLNAINNKIVKTKEKLKKGIINNSQYKKESKEINKQIVALRTILLNQ